MNGLFVNEAYGQYQGNRSIHRGSTVLRKISIFVALTVSVCVLISSAMAGGGIVVPHQAQLDPTLMAHKDQGVWYFLCEAPTFYKRIPPHYVTYGPPPPPYCCPPAHPGIPNGRPPQVVVAPN